MPNDAMVRFGGDTSHLDAKMKGISKNAKSAGTDIARGLGLGLGFFGLAMGLKNATDHALKFEKGMAEVSTIADATNDEMKSLAAGVENLSILTGQAADIITKGLYDAISAGVPKENALTFLEVASKAAIAGVTEVSIAVDGLTTVMNAYQMSAEESMKISDTLFQVVKDGKITFEELSENISKLAPTARAAGLTLEQMSAAIATAVKVEKPERAMTALRAALIHVTKEGQDLFQVARKFRGATLGTILEAGFAKRAAQGIMLLSNNAELLTKELENMENVAGNTEAAFRKMADTEAMGLNRTLQTINAIKRSLGDIVAKSGILQYIADVVDQLDKAIKLKTKIEEERKTGKLQGKMIEDIERAESKTWYDKLNDFLRPRPFTKEEAEHLGMPELYEDRPDIEMGPHKDIAKAEEEKLKRGEKTKKQFKEEAAAAKEAARVKEQEDAKRRQEAEKRNKQIKDEGKAISSTIDKIRKQIQLESLRKQGLEKEAYLKQKIWDLEKKIKRELTEQEKAALALEAENLFALKKKEEEKKKPEVIDQREADLADQLSRIGGTVGGAAKVNVTEKLDRERNKLLTDIAWALKQEKNPNWELP